MPLFVSVSAVLHLIYLLAATM